MKEKKKYRIYGSQSPFLPREVFFWSIQMPDGSTKRLNAYHIQFIIYIQEIEEIKGLEKMADDLGWAKKTVLKVKKELSYPLVENDSPLIKINEFRDENNQLRHAIEVFPPQV